ncbi:MAG: hypothetical protein KIT40_09260 [Nitrospira sp.]|nr:hypothetical protein [Nitrospira sp.]
MAGYARTVQTIRAACTAVDRAEVLLCQLRRDVPVVPPKQEHNGGGERSVVFRQIERCNLTFKVRE